MKTIQLIGNNFPKIRYAFMSKLKPNPNKMNLETSDKFGK